jgi:hypothetical protein
MIIPIPKGKEVVFQQGGGPISGTENSRAILNEDLTLSFSSSFSSIAESSAPKAFKALAGVLRDTGATKVGAILGGEFKQLGFQVWTGTEPLSTTLSLKFSMDRDAKKDVMEPVLAITKLALPSIGDKDTGALIGPGPSILSTFEEGKIGSFAEGKNLHCYIGNFKISNIIVTRAVPTFSKHTDQYGYPIWATLELSFTTVFSATVEMLKDMVGLL